MAPTRKVTYCRICAATCGLVVEVEDNRVIKAIGDVDNPNTRGFSCPKGRHIGDFVASPDRLQTSLRRTAHGFEPVEVGAAISEISHALDEIIAAHGPESVGFFSGTQAAYATLTSPFAGQWWATVGSPKSFGTMTIDQSAMWVADGRLGMWAAGRQRFDQADVWMLVGTNPLISLQPPDFTGVPMHDPRRRIQEAQAGGLQLIVVDPRRTEVAAMADLHLQLRPGTDVALFAGLLHLLLSDGHFDADFCGRWVDGLDELRAAVAHCDPSATAAICGVERRDLEAAALIFGTASSGMVMSGTGPDMGPWSNIAEHLIRSVNVVCGRYPRQGDRAAGENVLGSPKSPPGMAIGPNRTWERGYQSRFGFGLMKRQLPSATLPAEILDDGHDRIRALFVSGANPAAALPDMATAVEAMSALELLVVVDPFLSETAQLAHYVIAPKMHLERPDTTRGFEGHFEEPFAQVTPAVVEAPPGVIDDWEFWLRMAWERGHTVSFAGRQYAPGDPMPSTDDVLASLATRGRVTLDEVAAHPHGKVFPELQGPVVGPPTDAAGRFELLAPDVADELGVAWGALAGGWSEDGRFRLVVRRTKETVNTLGKQISGLPQHRYNPCFVHPDDLSDLGVDSGADIVLTSDHGSVAAVAQADATMRRGAVSMTHGFGALDPDADHRMVGTNTSRLLSLTVGAQTINAMPQMSAIPVRIEPAR